MSFKSIACTGIIAFNSACSAQTVESLKTENIQQTAEIITIDLPIIEKSPIPPQNPRIIYNELSRGKNITANELISQANHNNLLPIATGEIMNYSGNYPTGSTYFLINPEAGSWQFFTKLTTWPTYTVVAFGSYYDYMPGQYNSIKVSTNLNNICNNLAKAHDTEYDIVFSGLDESNPNRTRVIHILTPQVNNSAMLEQNKAYGEPAIIAEQSPNGTNCILIYNVNSFQVVQNEKITPNNARQLIP